MLSKVQKNYNHNIKLIGKFCHDKTNFSSIKREWKVYNGAHYVLANNQFVDLETVH